MTNEFWLDWSVRSTIVLLIAWALTEGLRRRFPDRAHRVWLIAVLMAAISAAVPWVTGWSLPRPSLGLAATSLPTNFVKRMGSEVASDAEFTRRTFDDNSVSKHDAMRNIAKPPTTSANVALDGASKTDSRWSLNRLGPNTWMSIIHATGSAFMIIGMVTAWLGTRRLRQRCRDCRGTLAEHLLDRLRSEASHRRPITVVQYPADDSGTEVMPCLIGLLHPTVVLPSCWHRWSTDRLEHVLRHEIAHVVRRDLWTATLVHAVRSLMWFHPLVWLAKRRMDEVRESACDLHVVDRVESPLAYAESLLHIADQCRGRLRLPCASFAAALSMASPSSERSDGNLRHRVAAVIAAHRDRVRPPVPARVRVWLAVSAVIISAMTMSRFDAIATEADPIEPTEITAAAIEGGSLLRSGELLAELVAIGRPGMTPRWWTSEGRPLDETPYVDLKQESTVHAYGDAVDLVIAIRSADPGEKTRFQFDGGSGYQRNDAKLRDGKTTAWVYRVHFAKLPPEGVTIRALHSHGSWHRGPKIVGRSPASMSIAGGESLAISPPIGDQEHVDVYASVGVEWDEADFRLVALDQADARHASATLRTSSAHGRHRAAISLARFEGLSIDDYRAVQLETRPYKRFELSGVPVEPKVSPVPKWQHVGWQTPATGYRYATLWDKDDDDAEGHLLDLRSGQMIVWDGQADESAQAEQAMRSGSGDLLWDNDLLCLRNGQLHFAEDSPPEGQSVGASATLYDDVGPERQIIAKLADGSMYHIETLAKEERGGDGLIIRYRKLEGNEREAVERSLNEPSESYSSPRDSR